MTVPVEAWPVPSVVQAPLKYRVKSDEKPMVYPAAPSVEQLTAPIEVADLHN